MSTSLVVLEQSLLVLSSLADTATGYARDAKSKNTQRSYASDLRDFASFCRTHGLETAGGNALPATPQTVALYLTHLASAPSVPRHPRNPQSELVRASVATINRRMVAIAQAHKKALYANPVADPHVREIVQGIKRSLGTAQRKKTALTADHLPNVLLTMDTTTIKGKRDKAILLLTFFCAARRSEIAALNIRDLRFEKSGLVVTIRRSKTDQTGEGREIGVPLVAHQGLCAVRAVQAWLDVIPGSLPNEPLFRTFGLTGKGKVAPLTDRRIDPADVGLLVKRVTKQAGIVGDFGAHSLRAGFITSAASTPGVTEQSIQAVSGHRSVLILRGYVRRANVFQDAPASAMFGGV
jgi:integrase